MQNMNVTAFCNLTPCSLVVRNVWVESVASTLKVESSSSSQLFVAMYQTVRCRHVVFTAGPTKEGTMFP
jgi:hypothetical protein